MKPAPSLWIMTCPVYLGDSSLGLVSPALERFKRAPGCRGMATLGCLSISVGGERKLLQVTPIADWLQDPGAVIPKEPKKPIWTLEQKQNSGPAQNMGTGTPHTWRPEPSFLKPKSWRASGGKALQVLFLLPEYTERAAVGNKKYCFSK